MTQVIAQAVFIACHSGSCMPTSGHRPCHGAQTIVAVTDPEVGKYCYPAAVTKSLVSDYNLVLGRFGLGGWWEDALSHARPLHFICLA